MTVRGWILALLAAAIAAPALAQEAPTASDCAVCHEDVVAAFGQGAHGQAMSAQSEQVLEWSCVACHGQAEAHLDDPMTGNISRAVDPQACLGCHPDSSAKMELLSSAHNRHGVTCLDCHDPGHGDANVEHMLLDEPRDLCATCHRIEAGMFRLPYAHRDGTKPFSCNACHSVHGDTRVGRLELLSAGGACVDCHTEKARPFVFPHPPVHRPGCVSCHVPHGATNPRLLTRRSIHLLCLECHADTPAFHDISQSRYRNCQTCHAAIHGSNRDPRLIEE